MSIRPIHQLLLILVGLVLFNLDVGNDHILARYWFAFPYAVLIPGFLLTVHLRLKTSGVWERLLYSAGLGIALLMLLGLTVNALLPLTGISQPLSQIYLLISFNVVVLIGTAGLLFRRETLNFSIAGRKPSWLEYIFLSVLPVFPVLAALGANRISNGYSNELTILLVSLMMLFIIALLTVPVRIKDGVYIAGIYSISLAVLWMLSMRNTLIVGSDIMTEYKMFQLTLSTNHWLINSINHAYYACLSITVLPTVFSRLLNVDAPYVFKILFQMMTALIPVTVFLLAKRFFSNNHAFLAAVFFISFPTFINALPMHIRQESAFIFFALLVYSLFTNRINDSAQKAAVYIFALAMILSHYSTSYISIILFFFMYLLALILRTVGRFLRLGSLHTNVSLFFVIFLAVTTLFWYSDLNNRTSNIVGYVSNSIRKLNTIFKDDIRKDQTSPLDQFNLNYKPPDKNVVFKSYMNRFTGEVRPPDYYEPATYADYQPTLVSSDIIPRRLPKPLTDGIYFAAEIIKKVFKLFIILGCLIMLLKVRKKHFHIDIVAVTLAGMIVLLIFMIVPFFTLDYDLLRTFQQLLVFLVIPLVFPLTLAKRVWLKRLFSTGGLVLGVSYFLIYTNLLNQVVGSSYPTLQFNNFGDGYNIYYLHESELYSSKWFEANREKSNITIYADTYSNFKYISSTLNFLYPNQDIVPANMLKRSYAFLTYPNEVKRITYKNVNSVFLIYTYPYDFMQQNKNLIYSNKKSSIFR